MRGESVSTYPHRSGAEASSDAVDVVKLLRDPTDQAPNVRSLHVQLDDVPRALDPVELHGRVSSARRRGDGDDEAIVAGLRLSTTTI